MSEQTIPQSTASAERLLGRLLELIVTCEQISDFTPTRIGRAMARKLDVVGDQGFGVSQKLTADWWYALTVTPDFFLGPRVTFCFADADGSHDRPMTDIGRLSFDRVASRLESAGFQRTELYGEHFRQRGHLFRRKDLRVEVLTRSDTDGSDIPAETTGECCVWAVQVS